MTHEFDSVRRLAADIRIWTIRQMEAFGAGHIGGASSIADTLAVLYGGVMRVDPKNPAWEDRDYLVMSKGHCGPALYAALALRGFFPMEWLSTLNKIGTRLPSHCDRLRTPGIDASTGSLGQGTSLATGMAFGRRMRGSDGMVYCIVGDGELQEGQVWEAVQFAATHKLDNLVFLIDQNGAQLDGYVADICEAFDVQKKFEAFGFRAVEVNGHDVEAIAPILTDIRDGKAPKGKPHAIILKTKKGTGCLYAERKFPNHHLTVSKADAEESIAEIERRYSEGLMPGGEQP
ncbi:MAG: transketolase [Oscillospiraceae bacterium]|nr:transketolase [Clostridiales bacterium]MBR4869880.1 transketolase [Oscillospiraceae bacterium]